MTAQLGLQHPIILQDGPLSNVLATSVKLGVGYRKEGYRLNTQSISAPIFRGPRVIACLTVIWTASALSFDKALEQYKDKLLQSAHGISDALNQIKTAD